MVIAIDPGNEYSAYAVIDEEYRPLEFGKVKNDELLDFIEKTSAQGCFGDSRPVWIVELVSNYGMVVGTTVFDTCRMIGRIEQELIVCGIGTPNFVKRKEYVSSLCGSARAKDTNVIEYLVNRFASGLPNRGKGTKKSPGWFYGFKADIWQAYAIAVWMQDQLKKK